MITITTKRVWVERCVETLGETYLRLSTLAQVGFNLPDDLAFRCEQILDTFYLSFFLFVSPLKLSTQHCAGLRQTLLRRGILCAPQTLSKCSRHSR